jgi:hypothetical protein
VTVPVFRRGYDGADVASGSALAQRHQLGGTGADARSARADAPGILLASHVAAADPHAGYLLESLLDAKGDLIAASADNTPARVAVGADAAHLVADSTQAAGVRWQAMTWTTYTPTWGATGTAPTIGNGTRAGASFILGKLMHFRIVLTMGSTTTFGTGVWTLSLPATLTSSATFSLAYGLAYDSSVATVYTVVTSPASTTSLFVFSNASLGIGPTVPFTWANGDVLTLNGTVEVA